MMCERCGNHVDVGDWPYCPHGTTRFGVQPDSVPGGFVVENAWREPRKFYSQSEYHKALAADNMELCPRWVPGSKHMTNWATIDPQTLENGRILAERQVTTRANQETVTLDTLQMTTRTLEQMITVKADL